MSEVRNGALPKSWKRVPLAECCEIILGQSPPGSTYNTEGHGLPFFQGKAEFGDLFPQVEKWCSEPKKVAEKGDVLISVRAPVGPTNLAAERSAIGRGLAAIRGHGGIPSRYILYALRAQESEIAGKGTGSTFSSISGKQLREIPINLAPLAEQYRIVGAVESHFTRLDAAVSALERVRVNLKRYRASVLKAACEGRLVPTEAELARREGRDYEPADVLLERILKERRARWEAEELARLRAQGKEPKDDRWKRRYKEPEPPDTSGLPELPEGWVWASVDQLTSRITSGSRDWKPYYGRGSGTFIMAQNVRMGRFDLSFRQPVDPPVNDASRERSQIADGDLLVTIVGANTGEVCRVQGEYPEHYVCQSVALMRPTIRDVAPYLELFLMSPENGQKQFNIFMYGAGRPHLSFNQLRATAIALPPLREQHRIVEEAERRLTTLLTINTEAERSEALATRLRQSILKRAFEGRLVPQDPSDEPASVLLERILAERESLPRAGRKGRTSEGAVKVPD